MKKLILALMLAASMGYAGVVKEQSADVNANDVTGNYDSYNWIMLGRDSQNVTLNITFDGVTNNLSSWTMGWKASRMTPTGQVDYISIPATNITAGSDGVVTFSITNTAIPPDNSYKTELYGFNGAQTNLSRTLAQGMIDVRQSLYESDNLFTFPNTTGLVEYVRKDGDFDQFTGLSSVTNFFYRSDGDGTGTWTKDGSSLTNLNGSSIASGTVADARIASTIARDSELTQVIAGDGIGVVTSGVNRTVSVDSTVFRADGSVAMTGDINAGGQAVTNVANVTFTTNSTMQFTGTVSGTNFVGWLDGTNTYRILFDQ